MSNVAYGVLWLLINAVGRLFFRYRADGREHVPKEGGVVLAANHASTVDIPFLACSIRRRMWFLGRQDLFVPGLRAVIEWMGWIPIRQDRLDREGFGKAIGLIKEGKVVAIYPEGTRTPDGKLRRGRPGIGLIVAETGCPVVPVYLDGTRDVMPIGAKWIHVHPIHVTYGAPIDFAEARQRLNRKDFYQHVSRIVMRRIAELGHVAPPAESGEREPAS